MSWDQPAYSFGTPNAQPPTPTKTPTSAQFPSPAFHTPRNNNSSFEDRSAWTPTFAEEYSVFNSTPGRLTSNHPTFGDAPTPRPLTAPDCNRRPSHIDELAAELATHVHHLSPNPNLPLPPVDPSVQLASSPGAHITQFETEQRRAVTPQRPKQDIEDPFSGQTATPPATQSKGTRKLAPRLSSDKMQNDPLQDHFGMGDTPTHAPNMLDFPTTSPDFFSYPMSAPATAPLFTNTKPFWETDQGMGGMDLDFDANLFNTSSHKIANSLDWGRSNQIFQEEVNNSASLSRVGGPSVEQQSSKRPRQLAPKVDLSEVLKNTPALPEFEFHDPSQPRPQPINHVEEAVDPANLWSRTGVATSMAPPTSTLSISPSRPATSQAQLQPYSQQMRESLRDQEEFQQDRLRSRKRMERAAASSPVRSSIRPGLYRSMSENRGRRTHERVQHRLAGRTSPLKRVAGLSSIPETAASMRTEVKLVIDKNGRATTETVIVNDRPGSLYDDDFSQSASSSDEEPPLTLSRNTSFDLPQQTRPRIGRLDSHSRESESRGHSAQNSYSRSESSRSSYRSTRRGSTDSEAETVMESDATGDATQEIKKMMEARKQQSRVPGSSGRRQAPDQRPRPRYYAPSSTISPSSTSDFGRGTPSSTRSGTTRCVCKSADSEGFMIQCESCDYWLHTACVNIDQRSLPPVYICAFCAQTPNKRGPRIRDTARNNHTLGVSPLAHKSFQSFR